MREEVDDETEAAEAEDEMHDAHHQRQQCRSADVSGRTLLEERLQWRGGEQ